MPEAISIRQPTIIKSKRFSMVFLCRASCLIFSQHTISAINGRVSTAQQHYGGTYDAGHAQAINVVQQKHANAVAGAGRN